MTEPLDLPRHPGICVTTLPGRGRGVVAMDMLRKGELIEVAPVIPLTPADALPEAHPLFDYAFAWDEAPFAEAIAFGIVSLVNHDAPANATLSRDHAEKTIRLVAASDIAAGEEITIDYGIPLWFEPA